MNSNSIKLAVTLFCLLSYSCGFADPSISGITGTVSNGQTLTISGSDFGSKSNAQPLVWDTFESGSNGSNVGTNRATIGNWDTGVGYDSVLYSTQRSHGGSKSALHRFTRSPDVYNVSLSKNGSWNTLYMDYWLYLDYSNPKSRNWKLWRLYDSGGGDMANHVFWCSGGYVDMGNVGGWWPSNMGHYSDNRWYHVQLVLKMGQNGKAKYYFNGAPFPANTDNSNLGSRSIAEIRIGHYWANDSNGDCGSNPGADVFVDNVYIDTSLSRVEIGDAPTYADSRHKEIQIPSSWNSNSIDVRINTGSMRQGDQAYLFVIDGNDRASQGYPITIGAGGVVRPNSPENLRAE